MGLKLMKVLEQLRKGSFKEKVLHLDDDGISDKEACDLAKCLKEAKCSIQGINLSNNLIGDEGALALAGLVAEMKDLESVVIRNNKIGFCGASALIESGHLKKLDLSGNILKEGIFDIKNSKSFSELNLSGCQLEAKSISSMIKKIKAAKLDLSCNYLGDAAFEVLSAREDLEEVNLEQNSIVCKADTKQSLSSFLERNTSLQVLNLEHNLIGKGAHIIAVALKDNRTLKILQLGWNQIGKEGLRALEDLPEIKIDIQHNTGSGKISFFEKKKQASTPSNTATKRLT